MTKVRRSMPEARAACSAKSPAVGRATQISASRVRASRNIRCHHVKLHVQEQLPGGLARPGDHRRPKAQRGRWHGCRLYASDRALGGYREMLCGIARTRGKLDVATRHRLPGAVGLNL